MKKTYAEKLRDPRWQKKRLQVLNHAKFRCQLCGSKDRTLHVHHSYYLRGKEPWEYPTGSMVSLCEKCHEAVEGRKPKRVAARRPVEAEVVYVPDTNPNISVKERFGSIFLAIEQIKP